MAQNTQGVTNGQIVYGALQSLEVLLVEVYARQRSQTKWPPYPPANRLKETYVLL